MTLTVRLTVSATTTISAEHIAEQSVTETLEYSFTDAGVYKSSLRSDNPASQRDGYSSRTFTITLHPNLLLYYVCLHLYYVYPCVLFFVFSPWFMRYLYIIVLIQHSNQI